MTKKPKQHKKAEFHDIINADLKLRRFEDKKAMEKSSSSFLRVRRDHVSLEKQRVKLPLYNLDVHYDVRCGFAQKKYEFEHRLPRKVPRQMPKRKLSKQEAKKSIYYQLYPSFRNTFEYELI